MRNRRFALSLLLLSATSGLSRAADIEMLSYAPPDSGILLGINVENLRASSFGQAALSHVKPDEPGLKEFIAATGFNPLQDVRQVLVAAPGGAQRNRAVFVLRGSFDPTRFAEFALQPGMTAVPFHGVQILTKKQENPVAIACMTVSLLVGGDPESVRKAIAHHDENHLLNEMTTKASELSNANDIWLVSRAPAAELASAAPQAEIAAMPQFQMLRSIEQASGGVKFGPELLLSADVRTHTAKDAADMVAMLRLFAGLAAASPQNSKEAAAILKTLKLDAEGTTVRASLAIPEAQVSMLVQGAMQNVMQQMNQKHIPAAAASTPSKTAAAPVQPKPAAPAGGLVIYSSPKDMGVVKLPAPK